MAKTTTAVHIAAFFSSKAETLLVDGDPNRSVIAWSERGPGLPFTVVDEAQLTRHMVETVEHVVIDTAARPETDDLRALAEGCDLLVKGAFTQSRLRQMIFGGATSHILAHAELPVLMAH